MKSSKQSSFDRFIGRSLIFGLLCACFLSMFPAKSVLAQGIIPPYSAVVPLSVPGPEGEMIAFQTALKEVFIKVSGQSQIERQASIQQAIQQASNWVMRFESVVSPIPVEPGQVEVSWIRVDFEPARINSRIEQAGFKVWKGSRGPVLVWLMLDHSGTPVVLSENDEVQSDWVMYFKQAAQTRGITVIFPVLDLYERTQLNPFLMKTLDVGALKNASLRYHNTHFLGGYIQEKNGQWESRWMLNQETPLPEWQVSAQTKESLMQAAAIRFADEWMKNSRSQAAQEKPIETMIITVNNINTIKTYTEVLRRLETVNGVSEIQPAVLSKNTAVFNIKLQGLSYDLIQGLSTETWLVPREDIPPTETHLYYQYVP